MIQTLGPLLLGGVTVTLPMEARVAGTELALGQVVEVTGEDPDLVAAVRSLSLGYAPAPGFSRLIWNHRVVERIADYDPSLDVVLRGQRAVRVWPEVHTVSGGEITRVAELELEQLVGQRDVGYELREPVADLQVPVTEDALALRARPARGRLEGGLISVPVEVRVGDETYRTVWTSWKVQLWETVPVLVGGVQAGERISPAQLESRRRPAEVTRSGKPLSPELLLGATAARDMQGGEVVTELDVHRPPVVAAGDALFLQVTKGSITARVPAVAMQPGSVGDRIRVTRQDARVELSSVIIGRDVVEIDLREEPR